MVSYNSNLSKLLKLMQRNSLKTKIKRHLKSLTKIVQLHDQQQLTEC